MMISPHGDAVFVEVPKTGSTSCTIHLRDKGKWFQNGSRGTKGIPGVGFTGRHSYPNVVARRTFDEHGVVAYGVVRNPWDRMASLWRASATGNTRFLAYMTTGKFRHGPIDVMTCQQRTWLEHVDHVLRYEELDRTWDQMAHQFGHLPLGPLPRVNVSKRQAKPEWTQEEVDIIAERFKLDIDTYGYTGPT